MVVWGYAHIPLARRCGCCAGDCGDCGVITMRKPSPITDLLLAAIQQEPRGSYRRWMEMTGISSSAVIRHHLRKLEEEGAIKLHPGQPRSVELVNGDVHAAIALLGRIDQLDLPPDLADALEDAIGRAWAWLSGDMVCDVEDRAALPAKSA